MSSLPLIGPARWRIVSILREGGRSAGEVALRLGIQTSAARKHLERFVQQGIVEERFVRGKRGRPKKMYALTEEGRELFPRRYDAVLDGLLGTLVSNLGPETTQRLVAGLAEELARPSSRGSGGERIGAAVARLNEMGFEAAAKREGRTLVITSRNCPLLRTAKSRRDLVCVKLHEEILRRATGAKRIQRGKWIVDGDSVCTHTIET